MLKNILSAYLLITVSFIYAQNRENINLEINTPHTDSIFAMDIMDSENLLITASDDGSIRLWDRNTKKVAVKMQVSHMEIKKAVINPVLPIIAVVETDGISNFFLSVWNYKEGKKIYSKRIQEVPLAIKFSPQGTWLAYSLTKWDSFYFIDPLTGKNINSLNISNQIVYDFLISASEKTILLYKSSGSLDYINTADGTPKKSFKTESNLINTSFNKDNVLMAASKGKKLYIIDLLTGSSLSDTLDCDEIQSVKFFKNSNKIYCASTKESKNYITVYIIKNNKLFIENRFETVNNVKIDTAIVTDDLIFYSGDDFNIYFLDSRKNESGQFIKHNLMDILDLDFSKESMTLISSKTLLNFKSDFFEASENKKPEYLTADFNRSVSNNLKGLCYLNETDILIWDNSGSLNIYNTLNKNIIKALDINTKPVLNLEKNGAIVFIQNKDKCLLYDNLTDKLLFEYNYSGFITSTLNNDKNMIAGASSNSSFKSPLIFINTETGETVPLKSSNLLTYDIEYNESDKNIYTLGLETRNDKTITVIKSHSGINFDKSKTLYSYNGEDNNASILFDAKTQKLYTTMGFDSLKLISSDGVTNFMKGKNIPRKLFLNNDYIYALNRDKSITIWNINNGKIVMDFYVFTDMNWIALMPDKGFYSSKDPQEYISTRSDITILPEKLSEFRLY